MAPRSVPLVYLEAGRVLAPDPTGRHRPLGAPETARDALRKLFDAHGGLYLYDLEAQASGPANLEFIQALERHRVFPWVDAGCRKPEDAMDVLFAGAESLTVQLRHMAPEKLREVGEMSDADFWIGLTVDERGLEKQLRPRDVLELAERVAATGIVLYESERADYHAAENAGFEIQRGGIPVAWVARPGSSHTSRAAASDRFAVLVSAEARA